MWQMKTEIILVDIGALGLIKKGSEKFIKEIPGNLKDNTVGNTTYSTEGPIHQVMTSLRFVVWTRPLGNKYCVVN